MPLAWVMAEKAWVLPAAVVSRIITPALAHGSVLVMLTTLAVMAKSPVICR